MTESLEDNKRIIAILTDMLHEQRRTSLHMNALQEEWHALRLELARINSKQDSIVEAVDGVRETIVNLTHETETYYGLPSHDNVIDVEPSHDNLRSENDIMELDRRLKAVEERLGIR